MQIIFDTNCREITRIRSGIGQKVGVLIYLVFSSIFLTCLILYLDAGLATVYVYLFPLYMLLAAVGTWMFNMNRRKESKSFSAAGQFAEQMLANIKTVKIFSMERASISIFSNLLEQRTSMKYGAVFVSSISSGFMWFFIYSSYALLFWEGGSRPRPDDFCSYNLSDHVEYYFYGGEMQQSPASIYIVYQNIACRMTLLCILGVLQFGPHFAAAPWRCIDYCEFDGDSTSAH